MTKVHLDPYDHAFHEDPYPYYRALRENEPVYYNEERRVWLLTKWEDVRNAFRDFKTFISTGGVALEDNASEVLPYPMFITTDPPDHTRQRHLLAPLMVPEKLEPLGDYTRRRTIELLQPHLPTGKFDFVADLAAFLPMDVISNLTGVPAADRDKVRGWADDLIIREDKQGDLSQRNIQGYMNLAGYFEEHTAKQAAGALDSDKYGLLGTMLKAEAKGQMDHKEVVGALILLAIAGNETTTKLIGNLAYHLWKNPDQRRMVVENPKLIGNAVEEVLRLDGSSQIIARVVARDVEIRGKVIKAGSRVGLCIISANRDEAKFPNPDKFDITRASRDHMAFGFGLHSCLGAALARLEVRIVFEEILRRIPDYEIDPSGLKLAHSPSVRGFTNVPTTFTIPSDLKTAA
ncbi:MAG TPA: cytochrome P450 [Alphaproteobacteria bacterium]|nr:cytochrome P450 [Alphaproteobacteria bacterium]